MAWWQNGGAEEYEQLGLPTIIAKVACKAINRSADRRLFSG